MRSVQQLLVNPGRAALGFQPSPTCHVCRLIHVGCACSWHFVKKPALNFQTSETPPTTKSKASGHLSADLSAILIFIPIQPRFKALANHGHQIHHLQGEPANRRHRPRLLRRPCLTLARHPSETDERMMVRLAALGLQAHQLQTLCNGDAAGLWRRAVRPMTRTPRSPTSPAASACGSKWASPKTNR